MPNVIDVLSYNFKNIFNMSSSKSTLWISFTSPIIFNTRIFVLKAEDQIFIDLFYIQLIAEIHL